MLTPTYTILYVADPHASARLYGKLLDAQHVESSPSFVLFPLENGRMLGLWSKSDTVPAADFHGSGSELAFRVADDAKVDALHDQCSDLHLAPALRPDPAWIRSRIAGIGDGGDHGPSLRGGPHSVCDVLLEEIRAALVQLRLRDGSRRCRGNQRPAHGEGAPTDVHSRRPAVARRLPAL